MFPRKFAKVYKNQEWDEVNVDPRIRTKKELNRLGRSLESFIKVLSNNEPEFAFDIVSSFLDQNQHLKNTMNDSNSVVADNILMSIKKWMQNKLGKVKTNQEKQALDIILKAYTYS